MPRNRFDPFRDLEDFSAGFRSFQDAVNRMLSEPRSHRPWTPPVDILETDNELIIQADLPGVDMRDTHVEIENGTLTLKGERRFHSDPKVGYHRIERGYGTFARYFDLPDTVDPEKVKADYKNGVLTVTLPKKEIAKPRTIQVQVHNE